MKNEHIEMMLLYL